MNINKCSELFIVNDYEKYVQGFLKGLALHRECILFSTFLKF